MTLPEALARIEERLEKGLPFEARDIRLLLAEAQRLREAERLLRTLMTDARFHVAIGGNPNTVRQLMQAITTLLETP